MRNFAMPDGDAVDKLVGLPDYAVNFYIGPWPDGGWMSSITQTDDEYAKEQNLLTYRAGLSGNRAVYDLDIFDGFKGGVTAHGMDAREAFENLLGKLEDMARSKNK